MPEPETVEPLPSPMDYRRRLTGLSDSWRRGAACSGMGPGLFFPEGDSTRDALRQIAAAKAVCRKCQVRLHCLTWALAANAETGVWGGLSAKERRRLRRLRIRRHLAKARSATSNEDRLGALQGCEPSRS